jgi:hypothetical protein
MKGAIATALVLALAAPASAAEVVAAGDIATGGPGDTKTSNLVLALDPDAALTLGDNVYPSGTGSPAPYNARFEPTWGRISNLYMGVGNHDYYDGGPAGYLAYSPHPLQYSVVIGAWKIVHLDSQGPTQAAVSFLRSALNADNHRCELVAWHHPRFSSGDHGNDVSQAPLWNEAVAQGVDIVLNGHDHNYERFARTDGIRQFVVGTGGVGTRPFGAIQPGSQKRLTGNSNWGVLDLELGSTSFSWQFRAATGGTGTVRDSGQGMCRA